MTNEPLQRKTPYAVSEPRYSVSHGMVTTAFELPNYRIVQNLGGSRYQVRSRNIFATIGAQLQTVLAATSPCGRRCASKLAWMPSIS